LCINVFSVSTLVTLSVVYLALKEIGYVFTCLSVCLLDYSKKYGLWMNGFFSKFSGGMGCDPSSSRLDFGGGTDHDLDAGFQNFLKDSLFAFAL